MENRFSLELIFANVSREACNSSSKTWKNRPKVRNKKVPFELELIILKFRCSRLYGELTLLFIENDENHRKLYVSSI